MYPSILYLPFFNSRPRLQRFTSHLYSIVTSRINGTFLGIFSIVVALALASDHLEVILIVGIGYVFIGLFLSISVLVIILRAPEYAYRIESANLRWTFQDEFANEGNFSLQQDVTLTRDAQRLLAYFPLDEFVERYLPFDKYLVEYEGYRKEIAGYWTGFRPRGTQINIEIAGRRNVERGNGFTALEIPIYFPTSAMRIVLDFQHVDSSLGIHPELYLRHAGEVNLLNLEKLEHSLDGDRAGDGFQIICNLSKPKYGHSYILKWRRIDV